MEKEKISVKTTKNLTVPTDKLSFNPFKIPKDKFAKSLEKGVAFTEKVIDGEKIQTKYFLTLLDGYGELTPLNFFDRCTLTCCISAQQAGEKAVTTDVIFRMLTGRTHKNFRGTEKIKLEILKSIKRLMSVSITIQMNDVCKKFKYNNAGEWKDFTANILPCCIIGGIVDGKEIDVIKFYDKSPILRVATEFKTKQIIGYSIEPLNSPKIHNTQDNICIKNYVLYQIKLMKCGRRDNKTLKFDSIVETCGIDVKDRNKRHDVKQVVLKFLEHLKTIGEIKNFFLFSDGDLKNPVTNNQQKFHGFKIETE